jgi:hypothetical protein
MTKSLELAIRESHLLYIYAPPGSGKSFTINNLIVPKFGANVVDTDQYLPDDKKPYNLYDMREIVFKIQNKCLSNLPYLVFSNLHSLDFIYGLYYQGFTSIAVKLDDEIYEERRNQRRDLINLPSYHELLDDVRLSNYDVILKDFDQIPIHMTERINTIQVSNTKNAVMVKHKFDSWKQVMYLYVVLSIARDYEVSMYNVTSRSVALLDEMVGDSTKVENLRLFSNELDKLLDNQFLVRDEYDFVFVDPFSRTRPNKDMFLDLTDGNYIMQNSFGLYDLFLACWKIYSRQININIGVSRVDAMHSGMYVRNCSALLYEMNMKHDQLTFPFVLRMKMLSPIIRSKYNLSDSEYKDYRGLVAVEYFQDIGLKFELTVSRENTGILYYGRRKNRREVPIFVSGHIINMIIGVGFLNTYPDLYMDHIRDNVEQSENGRVVSTYERFSRLLWHNYYDYKIGILTAVRLAEVFKLPIELDVVHYVEDELDDILQKHPTFRLGSGY